MTIALLLPPLPTPLPRHSTHRLTIQNHESTELINPSLSTPSQCLSVSCGNNHSLTNNMSSITLAFRGVALSKVNTSLTSLAPS